MRKKKKTTINELRDTGAAKLSRANINLREADTLLAYVLGCTESYCVSHPDENIPPAKVRQFLSLVSKRIQGVPMAYLKEQKGFFGLDFYVDKRVLIPRPETEILIEWVLKHLDRDKQITIADIGTGSGCIAVTLAKYLPKSKIYATDKSVKALRVAKKNAHTHKVKSKISFKSGSLLDPLKKTELDLIVSNLPYLEKHELAGVPYEPVEALYGGNKGLEAIDNLISQILERHIPRAILEIHPLQEAWLDMRMRNISDYSHYFIYDYSEKIRALILEEQQHN